MTDGGGNRPSTAHHQNIAGAVLAHMVKRTADTMDKFCVGWHPFGADDTIHPLPQAIPQEPKVVAVNLGCVWFLQRLRVDGLYHRLAVVFVEARPYQRVVFKGRTF